MAPGAARGGPTKVSGGTLHGPTFAHTMPCNPCSFDHDLTHPTENRLFTQWLLAPVMPIESVLSVTPSVTSAATPSSILLVTSSTSDKQPAASLTASPSAKKHIVATGLLHDCLGMSVADLSHHLCSVPPWASFIHDVRGPSYLTSTIQDIPHTAASYLQCLHDDGAPSQHG